MHVDTSAHRLCSVTDRPSSSRPSWSGFARSFLALALLLAAPSGFALAQEGPQPGAGLSEGAALAKGILEASEKERGALVRRALALCPEELTTFMAWVGHHAGEPGVANSLSVLEEIQSDRSAKLLAKLAGISLDVPYGGSVAERALQILVTTQKSRTTVPLLVQGAWVQMKSVER